MKKKNDHDILSLADWEDDTENTEDGQVKLHFQYCDGKVQIHKYNGLNNTAYVSFINEEHHKPHKPHNSKSFSAPHPRLIASETY